MESCRVFRRIFRQGLLLTLLYEIVMYAESGGYFIMHHSPAGELLINVVRPCV